MTDIGLKVNVIAAVLFLGLTSYGAGASVSVEPDVVL